ncbi:hypothetical protein FD723_06665 [Nostoc sp. C052]|uniref:hypothetical protein n=1 Tax=Nostoc sp. C052 TaxID=2576902 RepID=UPI0015C3DA69|nr:hypothetical protein [Nostoc sp. C052]QLE40169.1 hypothetical protein FD723_06665 [Nostoc sp. C052]
MLPTLGFDTGEIISLSNVILALAWVGEEMPPIEEVWRLYLRRFTIADWHRFLIFVYIRHLQ